MTPDRGGSSESTAVWGTPSVFVQKIHCRPCCLSILTFLLYGKAYIQNMLYPNRNYYCYMNKYRHWFKNKTKVDRHHNFVALKIVIASSCSFDLKIALTKEKGDRKRTAVKSILFDMGQSHLCGWQQQLYSSPEQRGEWPGTAASLFIWSQWTPPPPPS